MHYLAQPGQGLYSTTRYFWDLTSNWALTQTSGNCHNLAFIYFRGFVPWVNVLHGWCWMLQILDMCRKSISVKTQKTFFLLFFLFLLFLFKVTLAETGTFSSHWNCCSSWELPRWIIPLEGSSLHHYLPGTGFTSASQPQWQPRLRCWLQGQHLGLPFWNHPLKSTKASLCD